MTTFVATLVMLSYGLSLPIILGRGLLYACSLGAIHDMYTFAAGAYILAGGYITQLGPQPSPSPSP